MTTRVLHQLTGRFAIHRFGPHDPIPAWALENSTEFTSITRTADELSVICVERTPPDGAAGGTGWHCLRVGGTFPLDEPGVLASVVDPLAQAGLSVFAVATHDTDYLLVADLDAARAALGAAGHEVRDAVAGGGHGPR